MDYSFCLPEHVKNNLEEGHILRKQGYRGRFAPSPTGALHFGNLRTALISWLKARLANGLWILRVDDLDKPRNRPGVVQGFQNDLAWLGLDWDGPIVFQSQRKGLYYSVLSALRSQGMLYPCRCTRSVLTEIPRTGNSLILYPGTCRDLKLSWGFKDKRLPSWRLKVSKRYLKKSGDVVLRRSDGLVGYHLATAVDELSLGITEVVRGTDLVNALSSQLAVIEALGQVPTKYVHVPIFCDNEGKKLSKRDGSEGLAILKSKGMNAPQVIGWLASSLGLVPHGAELTALELLVESIKNKALIDAFII